MYKTFKQYGTFNGCGRSSLNGEVRVMNPIISGKVFTNPYKVVNNDMRVFPPVQLSDYNHVSFTKAYPQQSL